jgi:polyisoprenoid-binding protein YceI
MKSLPFVCASVVVLLGAAPAVRADQQLVAAQSEIAFTSKQMGVPVNGKFRTFTAQIAFDPKKPEAAKINFTVDLASATLGSAETDAELSKPEWFNTKAFPQATFASSTVKATGAGKFEVSGKLTIKSISHDIVAPVTLTQSGATTTAVGAFTLKRLDFKIGEGDWKDTSMVADPVQVQLKFTLTGVGAM